MKPKECPSCGEPMGDWHLPGCRFAQPDEPIKCWNCGSGPCVCCPECGLPPWDKAHLEYCPEALRG